MVITEILVGIYMLLDEEFRSKYLLLALVYFGPCTFKIFILAPIL